MINVDIRGLGIRDPYKVNIPERALLIAPNGSGKSTLLQALFCACTGTLKSDEGNVPGAFLAYAREGSRVKIKVNIAGVDMVEQLINTPGQKKVNFLQDIECRIANLIELDGKKEVVRAFFAEFLQPSKLWTREYVSQYLTDNHDFTLPLASGANILDALAATIDKVKEKLSIVNSDLRAARAAAEGAENLKADFVLEISGTAAELEATRNDLFVQKRTLEQQVATMEEQFNTWQRALDEASRAQDYYSSLTEEIPALIPSDEDIAEAAAKVEAAQADLKVVTAATELEEKKLSAALREAHGILDAYTRRKSELEAAERERLTAAERVTNLRSKLQTARTSAASHLAQIPTEEQIAAAAEKETALKTALEVAVADLKRGEDAHAAIVKTITTMRADLKNLTVISGPQHAECDVSECPTCRQPMSESLVKQLDELKKKIENELIVANSEASAMLQKNESLSKAVDQARRNLSIFAASGPDSLRSTRIMKLSFHDNFHEKTIKQIQSELESAEQDFQEKLTRSSPDGLSKIDMDIKFARMNVLKASENKVDKAPLLAAIDRTHTATAKLNDLREAARTGMIANKRLESETENARLAAEAAMQLLQGMSTPPSPDEVKHQIESLNTQIQSYNKWITTARDRESAGQTAANERKKASDLETTSRTLEGHVKNLQALRDKIMIEPSQKLAESCNALAPVIGGYKVKLDPGIGGSEPQIGVVVESGDLVKFSVISQARRIAFLTMLAARFVESSPLPPDRKILIVQMGSADRQVLYDTLQIIKDCPIGHIIVEWPHEAKGLAQELANAEKATGWQCVDIVGARDAKRPLSNIYKDHEDDIRVSGV